VSRAFVYAGGGRIARFVVEQPLVEGAYKWTGKLRLPLALLSMSGFVGPIAMEGLN
jgi:hypothetical protein